MTNDNKENTKKHDDTKYKRKKVYSGNESSKVPY